MALSNKEDAGDLAFYLFDEDSRFVGGGVDAIAPGCVGAVTDARVEGEHVVTVMFGLGSFARNLMRLHFAVVDDDLVLQGSTDEANVERNAEDAQHLPGLSKGPAVRRGHRFPAR